MYKYLINIETSDKLLSKKSFQQSCNYIYNKYGMITHHINVSGNSPSKDVKVKNNIILKYLALEDVVKYINKLTQDQNETYINTFDEWLVSQINLIKKQLWQPYTKHYKAFVNKWEERKIANWSNVIPQFKVYSIEQLLSYSKPFPIVIKPVQWAQSSGVALLNKKTDLKNYYNTIKNINKSLLKRNYKNNQFIMEEYIPWDMFTVTYFVNNNWEFRYDQICKVYTLSSIWIPDFAILKRVVQKTQLSNTLVRKIEDLIKKTIKIYDIKNTFIFQDIKLDNKDNPKNIEINARIWWYRLEIYQKSLWRNLFDYVLQKKHKKKTPKSNIAIYSIFPTENGKILQSFNETVIKKINQLPSNIEIRLQKNKINQVCWFAKSGYTRLWSIVIKNNNKKQFILDCEEIEKNYKDLTILWDPDLVS